MLKKLFLLIFLAMAVLQAAPQISWADMDVSFKAGWTNSGPQNYGTSSSVVLTLTSTGTSDVIVRRVTMNGGQDISAKCTNVTIPCRMPPEIQPAFHVTRRHQNQRDHHCYGRRSSDNALQITPSFR